MQEALFCHEFHLADLRVYENCKRVVKGCDHVFNLAADMGGMGFIQSNHSVIMYNNTMISFNMMEVSRVEGIKRCGPAAADATRSCCSVHPVLPGLPRVCGIAPSSCSSYRLGRRFFYASSACIYPEGKQLNTEVEGGGLKEDDAWPAQVGPVARASLPLSWGVPTCRLHRLQWHMHRATRMPTLQCPVAAHKLRAAAGLAPMQHNACPTDHERAGDSTG